MNRCVGLLYVLLALSGVSASAGEAGEGEDDGKITGGLSLTLRLPSVTARRNAPFPLVLTITSRDRLLHQGRLRLRVDETVSTLFNWTSDEWVVSAEGRTAMVLLPPLAVGALSNGCQVRPFWIGANGEVDLGQRTLTAPDRGGRDLILALCLPIANVRGQNLQQGLSLERYASKPAAPLPGKNPPVGQDGGIGLRTVPVRLRPEELPEQALAWCAYDVAVIAGDALSTLKLRQVQALETWIRAGGSALVLLDGPVAPALAEMLRRSAAVAGRPEWFPSDDQGRIGLPGIAGSQTRLDNGLGRLVVAPFTAADRDDATADPQWRATVAFLWRLRGDQARRLANTSAWWMEPVTDNSPYGRASVANFLADSVNVRSQLIELLWPDQVAVIPFSVILAIFLVFVLAVGPGDWFLLGWLKARRFTWLLFPALAIACTWFTVWVSRRYLGASDLSQRLEIVDIDAAGATLRHDRIELVFTGESRTVAVEAKESLWAPLGTGQSSRRRYRQGVGYQAFEVDDGATAVRYVGTFPGAYRVEHAVAQWTPTLSRELSFAPCALPWTLDFTGINGLEQLRSRSEDLRRQAGVGAVVVAYQHGHQALMIGNPADLLDRSALNSRRQRGETLDDVHPWLQALCVRPDEGWFTLASQVSPMGGATVEDCALTALDDDQILLLVVAQRRGDTVWVVRRVLRAAE